MAKHEKEAATNTAALVEVQTRRKKAHDEAKKAAEEANKFNDKAGTTKVSTCRKTKRRRRDGRYQEQARTRRERRGHNGTRGETQSASPADRGSATKPVESWRT
jgi:hypothetical protein